jgi:hypothetical protein
MRLSGRLRSLTLYYVSRYVSSSEVFSAGSGRSNCDRNSLDRPPGSVVVRRRACSWGANTIARPTSTAIKVSVQPIQVMSTL